MLSAVAGIVDSNGKLRRVVITQPENLKYHIGSREKLYVLPGVAVCEPVSAEAATSLIARVEAYVRTRP